MVYNFKTQLAKGAAGEAVLDGVMAQFGVVVPVDMSEQRQGIDRLLLLEGGRTVRLEYKTDLKAQATGRLFVELAVGNRLGWAYSTTADRIVWYLPGLERVVIVPVGRLTDNLIFWIDTLPPRTVDNPTYQAKGVAVPLMQIEALASRVIQLEGDKDGAPV